MKLKILILRDRFLILVKMSLSGVNEQGYTMLYRKCRFTYAITGPRPRCALVNYITLYTILCALLGIFIPAQAMIYRPEKGAMWDPSVIWHDGKYYSETLPSGIVNGRRALEG
ncbi:MAG: hypothetical protein ACYSUB_20965 [Planctomycetota bacterium]|jgi:hypothetical protein